MRHNKAGVFEADEGKEQTDPGGDTVTQTFGQNAHKK